LASRGAFDISDQGLGDVADEEGHSVSHILYIGLQLLGAQLRVRASNSSNRSMPDAARYPGH
jgi:hypothetical protein